MSDQELIDLDKKCPHCEKGKLLYVEEVFPYSTAHWICENCDSTYVINEKGKEND